EVFNISLGLSLDKEPLVRSALAIISISAGEVPMDTLGPVLGSPYFMSEESEHMAFAAFLRRLREGRRSALTLRGLKRIIDKSKKQQLPGLFQRLGLWIKSIKDNGGVRRLPGEWAACFDELLKGLAWPSPALTLDSREYQALTAWHKLLGEFAGLDDVLGGLTWAGAAEELRAMAREAIHQPESVVESPVEVLGLLEASGMEFDATWLLGAHEDALPDRPAPNPFIPIYLQKEAGLPRATPELALEYGRAMLDRVLRSAPSVTVSFPRAAEGKELKVTPLLWGMGSYIKDPLLLRGHRLSHSVHASSVVEEFIDDKGPPLLGEELTGLRGGTGIIKEQSACPFRAFAMYRLGACGVSPPGPGLDPRERGSLVHEALKFFWRAVKDSEKLAEFHRDGTLFSLIGEAVEKALKPLVDKHRRPGLSKKILEVEAGRLQALLMDWMEVELKRVAFTVVETEKEHEVHVGGLRLRVFLDRVDELNDGKRIIIDYKTGACNKYDWLPKRPKEPQMLLYALEGGFNAIAFASLKRGEKLSFVGLGEEDGMLPRVRGIESDDKWRARAGGVDNWAVLNERWKETLTRLAADFQSGEASVDPNRETGDIEWPCKYCEFPMFCRKFELGFLNEEEEEEEDSVYG
ncbi:MAG: PD-(D/E)XK nuclease family protein, partial [Thermodesulfobacteriota bacterium]